MGASMSLADDIEDALGELDLFGSQRIDTLLSALKAEEEGEDDEAEDDDG
jgi:hypothetical protein